MLACSHLSPLGNAKSTKITEQWGCRGVHWICGRPNCVRSWAVALSIFNVWVLNTAPQSTTGVSPWVLWLKFLAPSLRRLGELLLVVIRWRRQHQEQMCYRRHCMHTQQECDHSNIKFLSRCTFTLTTHPQLLFCTCIIEYLDSAGLPNPLTPIKLLLK